MREQSCATPYMPRNTGQRGRCDMRRVSVLGLLELSGRVLQQRCGKIAFETLCVRSVYQTITEIKDAAARLSTVVVELYHVIGKRREITRP